MMFLIQSLTLAADVKNCLPEATHVFHIEPFLAGLLARISIHA